MAKLTLTSLISFTEGFVNMGWLLNDRRRDLPEQLGLCHTKQTGYFASGGEFDIFTVESGHATFFDLLDLFGG
jgi:hypothetical protein